MRKILLLVLSFLLSACSIPRLSETNVLDGEGVQFNPERMIFLAQYIDPVLVHAPPGTTADNLYIDGIGNPKTRIELLFVKRGIDFQRMAQPRIADRIRDLVPLTEDASRPFLYVRVSYGFQRYSPLPGDVRPFVIIEPIVQRGPGTDHLWKSISISGSYEQAVKSRKLTEWLDAEKDELINAFEPALESAIKNLQLVL